MSMSNPNPDWTPPSGLTKREVTLLAMLERTNGGWVTMDLIRAVVWPEASPGYLEVAIRFAHMHIRRQIGVTLVRRTVRVTHTTKPLPPKRPSSRRLNVLPATEIVTVAMFRLAGGLPPSKAPNGTSGLSAWHPDPATPSLEIAA
jgi:hypothetical protein